MSFEEYRRVILELNDMGARELTLTGGEPTLVKGFVEYLKLPVSLGWIVGFTTNGTTLRGRLLADLVASGVHRISISLDGLEKAHDQVRGDGAYRRAMEGLENLLATRGPDGPQVRINTVLMDHNVEDILPLHRAFAERKIWFNLMPFTAGNLSYHQGSVDGSFALQEQSKQRVTALMEDWFAQRRRLGFWLNTQAHLQEIVAFAQTGQRQKTCLVGAYQFNVDEHLKVGFCTEEIGVIGDLKTQTAQEVWQSQLAAEARKKVGTCKACVLNCYYTPSVSEGVFDLLPVLVRSR